MQITMKRWDNDQSVYNGRGFSRHGVSCSRRDTSDGDIEMTVWRPESRMES